MIIRDYNRKELPEIRNIIRKSLDKVVSRFYPEDVINAIYGYYDEDKIKSFERVIVSEEENKINGCVAFSQNEIKMLYPDPEFRQKAYVASMLLEYAKQKIREKGYLIVKGDALESSKQFLKKQGKLGKSYNEKIGDISFKITPVEIEL